MKIDKLEIVNGLVGKVIRTINFNQNGLSLIVDDSGSDSSGSNIGKSTLVKVIDLCFGADSTSSIYKDLDTGENIEIKSFIEKNKVYANLYLFDQSKSIELSRDLFPRGKCRINSQIYPITEYRNMLNEIFFGNKNDKPTFRQLMKKFVRLDNVNEEYLIKFLGNSTTNDEYRLIYRYLLGINKDEGHLVKIKSDNEKIDKEIAAILKKNAVSKIEELKLKSDLIQEEVEILGINFKNFSVLDSYKETENEYIALQKNLEDVDSSLNSTKYKIKVFEDKLNHEKKNILDISSDDLTQLYNLTKNYGINLSHDLENLITFHNGMLQKRMEFILNNIESLYNRRDYLETESNSLRLVLQSKFVGFNVELKEKHEEAYREYLSKKDLLITNKHDYEYILYLDKSKKPYILEDNNERIEQVLESFNTVFKRFTKMVLGESNALSYNNVGTPITFVGISGRLGTGTKKAMMACLDLAFTIFNKDKITNLPQFIIHDKLENIDLIELEKIVELARMLDSQYIFPILSDRIEKLNITESEKIVTLSKNEKLFKI